MAFQNRKLCCRGRLPSLAESSVFRWQKVYEVATFFASFDVVANSKARPTVTVHVSDTLSYVLASNCSPRWTARIRACGSYTRRASLVHARTATRHHPSIMPHAGQLEAVLALPGTCIPEIRVWRSYDAYMKAEQPWRSTRTCPCRRNARSRT